MSNTPVVIRLDDDLHRRVGLFQESSHLPSVSAAVRMLLALGLEKGHSLETAWRKAVVDEAHRKAHGEIFAAVTDTLRKLQR